MGIGKADVLGKVVFDVKYISSPMSERNMGSAD